MEKMSELFSLKGSVAVVTGASSGLGVTFARALAEAGAKVVVAARRKERLDVLVEELTAKGFEALAAACDVTDADDVDRMVRAALERFGRIDILVNNAGLSVNLPAEEEPVEDFSRVMEINVTGTFICSQRCGRVMLEAGRGSIINIASMLGLVGIGTLAQASYTASKGAVVNMTRELAAQWAGRGVRVNALGPGFFPSEMTSELFDTEEG
ncbi:MAG: SDR family NAD(P)-dependent oxidoreductase, partial [Deltaproteobacteria bacterium]|nr:SDR family NAD(P)-dependent oxidoreductase [Deltaproteobacteria bacterium]